MEENDFCLISLALLLRSSDSTLHFLIKRTMPSLLSNLKSAREYLSPTLKSSAFLSRGVLTPSEFVSAGDELVYKCPTWSWEAGDPAKRKKYLPEDKQYLVTRGVPCSGRVEGLENVDMEGVNECAGMDGDDGEWMVGRILSEEEVKRREEKALEDEFDILDGEEVGKLSLGNGDADNTQQAESQNNTQTGNSAEEEDEYADMADFEDDNVMTDEAAVTLPATATNPASSNSNILQTRTYDLSITYDKYYQTPRVYLMGYASSAHTPLSEQEMMQDVIKDYANKTVTMEYHPHVGGMLYASIHPCQHGAVMKTIVKNLMRDGNKGDNGPSVEMYLFIFLKFVSSIIPTINYDFTMDVSASTQK